MLHVFHSNRLEELAEELAATLARPVAGPLAPEIVVVQNQAMGRWVALTLARRFGVCANLKTPFPAAFVWDAMRDVLGDLPTTSPFAPEVLTWRVMQWLGEHRHDDAFRELAHYLADGDDEKRYQLAERIAATFDQYLVYRPDWIRAWEGGEGTHWQARLWRDLTRVSRAHWVRLLDRQRAALEGGDAARALPPRVSLFALPSLSPGYLDVIRGLAGVIEVHLFLLNPCREHWGEIVSEREAGRRAGGRKPEALYLESGNPLLASLGSHARDFMDMVQELNGTQRERFVDPGEDTLLHCLQHDVLMLADRGSAPTPLAPDDRSLRVHVCHSAMREIEVLHDRLLGLFAERPALRPSDVVVMTPDIDAYAPYIEAVFATGPAERRIPFAIAERSPLAESLLVETFFALLELPDTRFDANRVLALLEAPAMQRRFGLTEDDLELIEEWIRATGIRWGIDGAARARLGLPDTDGHTWRAGLERLLLGYALPTGERALFEGVLPYDDIEGSQAQALGKLHAFLDELFALDALRDARRDVARWGEVLGNLLTRFFEPQDADEEAMRILREAIGGFVGTAAHAQYREDVPLDLVRAGLRRVLSAEAVRLRGLVGGVTFCGMAPFRTIPFEVVCLVGMNDGSFPRPHRPLGFDLMAKDRRRGDRSRRDEDRYLFLEALLSARHCLYVSYTGRSIRDNSLIPPSVLVSELLDYLHQGFGSDTRERVVTEHPLQAFSHRYFEPGGALYSYSAELAEASRLCLRERAPPPSFAGEALMETEPAPSRVELEELVRFLRNPARYLLRRRLGLQLDEGDAPLETREPFALERPWELRDRLLAMTLEGRSGEAPALLAARGDLPHGNPGRALLEQEQERIAGLARRIEALRPAGREDVWVDLALGEGQLSGWLRGVTGAGLYAYRPVEEAGAHDRLALWAHHLALNAVRPGSESLFVARNEVLRLRPVAEPHAVLAALLDLYRAGQRRPLPFFPRTSLAFVDSGGRDPRAAARAQWEGERYGNGNGYAGEGRQPYYALAFRGVEPLDDEFERVAMAVYGPMREHEVRG